MKSVRLSSFCVIFCLTLWAQQGAQPILSVTGDVTHPLSFSDAEWKQLKHISVSATNAHDKTTASYSGVPLRELLKQAGVATGENLRGKAMSTTIVVSAADGYQAVFSIGELDESIGNLDVLVADSEDGKPLGSNVGPLRLVVPTDKRPARWVRMIKTIRVIAMP